MRSVSVIIASRNRAADLRETLLSLAAVSVPNGTRVEVIVVNNGSTDSTPEVVRDAPHPTMSIVYINEGRVGKSYALNSAISVATGEFLLFTDDDVRVPPDWIEMLVRPMLDGADAVAGRILLCADLQRPWLTPRLRWFLASPETQLVESPLLIGANMAFKRSVLAVVPGFDDKLGPGGSGLGEDTLFCLQLKQAGFRVVWAPDAVVWHHPDPGRLTRLELLSCARKNGRSAAYIDYHWRHLHVRATRVKRLLLQAKLVTRRWIQGVPPLLAEGCGDWELSYVSELEWYRQLAEDRGRPRAYPPSGLRRTGAGHL
jgi:glycosyltransferase involved in cell wall biosynthesis